ncbi:MAG: PspC domain-containing protein [Herpetosiphonaceae bacterium]|nr:PspC domain-containing protein [Herpetosiphonaceae bacterium]
MNNLLPTSAPSRLVRSAADRRIAGVCSGIAEYFVVDPIIVRLVFVALAFGGIGLVLYPIMWLVMPSAGSGTPNIGQGFAEMRSQVQQVAQQVQHQVAPGAGARFDPMTGRPLQTEAPQFDPYTGAPLPAETAVPITNHPLNTPVGAAAGTLAPQARRRRFLGIALVGLGLLVVSDIAFSVLVPALLIVGGFMLLRRAA